MFHLSALFSDPVINKTLFYYKLISMVLYVSSVGGNLISVKWLTKKEFKVGFNEGTCEIRTDDDKHQVAVDDIIGNLYQMRIANRVNAIANCQKLCISCIHQ